jgi:glycosyltransferase involved in cell wall biosynthesis
MLLITELLPAGAERIVYELATRLPKERWDVRVASLRSPGGDDGAVARDLRAAGLEVAPLRFRGKLDPLATLRFLRLVRRWRPDVLHAHLFHANLAARLFGRLGARHVVSTLHIVERRQLPARRFLERLTASRDDMTVCVSPAVSRHARAALGAHADRVRVISNGIDLSRFADPPDRASARAALALPADAEVVGSVGRLDRQKGLDLLVEAFAQLARERPKALLVLAGVGPEEESLRRQAATLNVAERVRFLGFQEGVPRVLAALDVFCMPSRWEGFGLSLVEALAAGVPTVASDVDSLPDVQGSAGVLVPPGHPPSLAQALEDLLNDPEARAALSEKGPPQAAKYDVQLMVDAYAALYEELLARGS